MCQRSPVPRISSIWAPRCARPSLACRRLERLPADLGALRQLHTLALTACIRIPSVPGLSALSALEQRDCTCCSELTGLEGLGACAALQELRIGSCPHLQRLDVCVHERVSVHSAHADISDFLSDDEYTSDYPSDSEDLPD